MVDPESQDEADAGDAERQAAEPGGAASALGSVIDHAHEAFVSMDAGGFVTGWNAEAERTFGWAAHEVTGKILADTIIPERFREAHWQGLQRYLSTGEAAVLGTRLEVAALHREGHELPVELTIAADRECDPPAFHAFLRDISARKMSERLLLMQAAVTRALAGADTSQSAIEALLPVIAEGMEWQVAAYWELDPEGGALSRRAAWHASEVPAESFDRLSADLKFEVGTGLIGRTQQSARPIWVNDFAAEPSFLRADAAKESGLHGAVCLPVKCHGEIVGVIELLCESLRAPDPSMLDLLEGVGEQIGHLLGVLEERSRLVEKLEVLALTDEVTGLQNRRAWEESLVRELARAHREGHPISVALIDLDGFKEYNDELGHPAGDQLLNAAARAWLSQLRASDVLARYGGDEFGLLFPAWPIETAAAVVERLRGVTPDGQTCSAGLALWDGSETAEELVLRADHALYAAKTAGRNRLHSA